MSETRSRSAAAAPPRAVATPPVRRPVPVGPLLIGLALLIVLALIISGAVGRLRGGGEGARGPSDAVRGPILSAQPAGGAVSRAALPSAPVVPTPAPTVAPRFAAFYSARGGLTALGLPISQPMNVNGREIQWFERARLEHWPEHAGTPYEVQLGRLGAEFTDGRAFPQAPFFVSRPGLRFFPETGHGVGGPILAFWEANGGLDAFGFPISEELDERLEDGVVRRVQYFERARLEIHPEHAGTPYAVQVGLLGRALFLNERSPAAIPPPPPAPTPVPLP